MFRQPDNVASNSVRNNEMFFWEEKQDVVQNPLAFLKSNIADTEGQGMGYKMRRGK